MSKTKEQTLRYHQQFTKAFSLILFIVSVLAVWLLIDIANDGIVLKFLLRGSASESRTHVVASLISEYVALTFATAVGLAGAFVAISIAKNTEVLQASSNKLQEQANELSKLAVKNEDPAYHQAYSALQSFKRLVFTAQAILTTDQISNDPKGVLIIEPMRSSVYQSEKLINNSEWSLVFIESSHYSKFHGVILEHFKEARYRLGLLSHMLKNDDDWLQRNQSKLNIEICLYSLAIHGLVSFITMEIFESRTIESSIHRYLRELLAKNPMSVKFLKQKIEIEVLSSLTAHGWIETTKHYFERHIALECFANKTLFIKKPTNDDLSLPQLLSSIYGIEFAVFDVWDRSDITSALASINNDIKVIFLKLNLTDEGYFASHKRESLPVFFDKAFEDVVPRFNLKGRTIVFMINGDPEYYENFPNELVSAISILELLNQEISPKEYRRQQALNIMGKSEEIDLSERLSLGLVVTTSDLAEGLDGLLKADGESKNNESLYSQFNYSYGVKRRPPMLVHLPLMLLPRDF